MPKQEIVDELDRVIWNPWHGCHKCSEGCFHCYMYEIDKNFGKDSTKVVQTRSGFRLPVQRQRIKNNKKQEKYELEYKVKSGSHIMTCLSSDFFIEEADVWRIEAWDFIHERNDCLFEIITKRPERIWECLPETWFEGWNNVIIDVTVENTNNAYQRIPILLDLPIKHRGLVIEPMLEEMDIRPFLSSGLIEHVTVGGESYRGWEGVARILDIRWVRSIREQCLEYEVPFSFHQTGTRLLTEDNKIVFVHRKKDEYGLAQFYDFDIEEAGGINWKTTAKELEMQSLAENAHRIYKQLTLEDFGIK